MANNRIKEEFGGFPHTKALITQEARSKVAKFCQAIYAGKDGIEA